MRYLIRFFSEHRNHWFGYANERTFQIPEQFLFWCNISLNWTVLPFDIHRVGIFTYWPRARSFLSSKYKKCRRKWKPTLVRSLANGKCFLLFSFCCFFCSIGVELQLNLLHWILPQLSFYVIAINNQCDKRHPIHSTLGTLHVFFFGFATLHELRFAKITTRAPIKRGTKLCDTMINEEKHAHETQYCLLPMCFMASTWLMARDRLYGYLHFLLIQANLNVFHSIPFHCKTEEAPYKQKYIQFSI